MSARWFLVPVVAVLALTASPAQAQVGHVHMLVRVVNRIFNDMNDLVYEVQVVNAGPDTATNVETIRNVLYCPTPTTPLTGCENTPPRVLQMMDVGPGGQDMFRTEVLVREAHPVTVRITIQVVHIDQHDDFSTPGTCNYGQVPQDDCDTEVMTFMP